MLKLNLREEFAKIRKGFAKMKDEINHKSFILQCENKKLQKEIDTLKSQVEELRMALEVSGTLKQEKLIGNTKTKKVHAHNCPHVKKIDFNHKMIFTTTEKAIHADFELCSCLK